MKGNEVSYKIAALGGDGIGPEVVDAAIPAIEGAAAGAGQTIAWERLPYGADHYLKTGETLPQLMSGILSKHLGISITV